MPWSFPLSTGLASQTRNVRLVFFKALLKILFPLGQQPFQQQSESQVLTGSDTKLPACSRPPLLYHKPPGLWQAAE